MNARNRIFIILGVLFLFSLVWYFVTTNRSGDLQLIGTVDANEVIISSRIPGRIAKLTVDEGDDVHAGELIATIQSDDLRGGAECCQGSSSQPAIPVAAEPRHRASDRWQHLQPGD